MEQKTKVNAEDGKQEIVITREFNLPLELLFKAYEDPGLFEQWMGTKVLKMENRKHGSYAFETSHGGNVVFRANALFTNLCGTKKSHGHLKWKIHLFPFSLSIWNLKN